MKKIKFLKIECSPLLVFEHINKALISSENIKILWSFNHDFAYGRELLAASERLNKLQIYATDIPNIFASNLTRDFQFKLKSLQITGENFENITFDIKVFENFRKFLIAQKDSLTDIDVTGLRRRKWLNLDPGCNEIFEIIFNELPRLESLKFDLFRFCGMIRINSNVFCQLKSNMSLKHLDCGILPVFKMLAIELLSKCPGLERLSIRCLDGDLLPFLAMNNTKLKSLTLEEIDHPECRTLKFEFLESFVVRVTGNRQLWLSFVMNNSSIRSFEILDQDQSINGKTLSILKTHPHLILFNNKELVKRRSQEKKIYLWSQKLFCINSEN